VVHFLTKKTCSNKNIHPTIQPPTSSPPLRVKKWKKQPFSQNAPEGGRPKRRSFEVTIESGGATPGWQTKFHNTFPFEEKNR